MFGKEDCVTIERAKLIVEAAFRLCFDHVPSMVVEQHRIIIEGTWSLSLKKDKWHLYTKSKVPDEIRKLREKKDDCDYIIFEKTPQVLEELIRPMMMMYSSQRIRIGLKKLPEVIPSESLFGG